jgi:hypothetical protein
VFHYLYLPSRFFMRRNFLQKIFVGETEGIGQKDH